ncbi:MAG: hypothetical protein EAZ30_02605 [Betaproteobacteria bacterium]|nr:MAG: hypothetical protein EAZ30_02605 [Betaproteobacteria bacterium]
MNNPKFKALPVTQPPAPPPKSRLASPFSKPDMSDAQLVSPAEAQARLKRMERQALAASALAVPNPNAGHQAISSDDTDQSSFLVPIDNVREYEHNPRRRSSEAIADLKASIAAKGIQQVITVTKRPGESFYIPHSGGNSRLRCAKELYSERSDANDYKRFAMLRVIYRAYTSESDIYAAHIAENEVRADIPFWDKARAAMELKRLIEQELGRSLSARELEQTFSDKGIPGARASLNYFSFAHNRLAALGEAGYFISRTQVREHIQRAFGGWDDLAKRADRETEYRDLLEAELAAIGTRAMMSNALETATLIGDVEVVLADFYGIDQPQLQRMLSLCDSFKDLSFEQLIVQSAVIPRAPREPRYAPHIPGIDAERRSAIIGQPPERATASGQRALLPPMAVAPAETAPQVVSPRDILAHEGEHSDASPSHQELAGIEAEEIVEHIRDLARSVLQHVALEEYLLDAPHMPLGFIVDAPVNGLVPISMPSSAEARRLISDQRYVFWIISMLCAQHPEHGQVALLPPCTWKAHITGEANTDPENDDISYCQQYLFSEMGGEPSLYELYRFTLDVNPTRTWVRDLLTLQALVGAVVDRQPSRFAQLTGGMMQPVIELASDSEGV